MNLSTKDIWIDAVIQILSIQKSMECGQVVLQNQITLTKVFKLKLFPMPPLRFRTSSNFTHTHTLIRLEPMDLGSLECVLFDDATIALGYDTQFHYHLIIFPFFGS
jgi:hypothetical protein